MLKRTFEFIGQHPLATGILAITGMIGFFLSVIGFSFDRSESRNASVILDRIDQSIIELTPKSGSSNLEGKDKALPTLDDSTLSAGVNPYLWRASLETLNFMPLAQVDPFGGVIVTDWYASPKAPDERFKANVYILDTNLRADALKTSIFKQTRTDNGWQDAAVDADTARQIENVILSRARELFIASSAKK